MSSKLYTKSVLLTAAAGFIVFAIYGFVVHGNLLQDTYSSLPATMWRNEADSQQLMHWIFVAYAIMAWMLAVMRPDSVKDFRCGLKYGFLAGAFLGSVNFINFVIQPLTMKVTLISFLADIVMVSLAMGVMAIVANRLSGEESH